MPVFNFQKQFAADVESGKKRQTIRAKREDGRNPHVGDKLFLYTGMQTKSCRKLGEAVCKEVHQITIDNYGVNIDGEWLKPFDLNAFILNDGFSKYNEMLNYFRKKHGPLPFEGLLYKW